MASQTMDDVIATVMSMGFELGDCQEAVQYGKIQVEEIVEWILAGKPGLAAVPSQTPRLQLGRPSSSEAGALQMTSNPFVSPIVLPNTADNSNTNSKMETGESLEDAVVSRHHLTDAKRKDKELFEEKKREEAKKRARQEKIAQRKEKERILKQIAEDRDVKKDLKNAAATSSPSKPTSSQSNTDNKSPEKTTKADNSCTLQIRLPDGRTLRKKFETEAMLSVVWDYCYTEFKSMHSMCFMQPFPRQEFNKDDLKRTLQELGLTPTGSLVVKPATNIEQATSESNMEAEEEEEAGSIEDQEDAISSRLRHRWGQGHRLEGEGVEIPDEEMVEEDIAEFAERNMPGAQFGNPLLPQLFDNENNQAFGGVGQRLLPEGHPDADVVQNRPAGQVAAEAALHRYQNPLAEPVNESPSPQPSTIFHTVKSLLNLVFLHLAERLDNPKGLIVPLSGMSEDLAQKLITFLLKQHLLKPKTLKAFVPCYVRRLVLDCYPLTTNELLQAVRLHSNLSILSLNSCPLITDNGFHSIAGLKKLKSLHLGSCFQLTNRCLTVVKDLPSLQTLNLMKTGVTDQGIISHVIPHCSQLQYLNLNGTNVTHQIIPPLKALTQLKFLLLEETKVCSLSEIQNITSLQQLDVSQTQIFNDSLLCLSQLPHIVSLNIASTDQLHGDMALQYITGLKLQNITLPSRHTTTNIGIAYITGFPLVSLDLTNYINVSDEGICHVGKIHSLKKLLLSNTKITDTGLQALKGLKDLEVLNLDRTVISDVGAKVIQEFTKLQELSLSATGITSRLLKDGALNGLNDLSKLNLSRTNINDKGIACLKLRSLTLINLDGTRVHPASLDQLKQQCPYLHNIILQNLALVREEEEEEMDE